MFVPNEDSPERKAAPSHPLAQQEPGGEGTQVEYTGAAGSQELIVPHTQGISYTVSDSSRGLGENSEQENIVSFHVVHCKDAISSIIGEK